MLPSLTFILVAVLLAITPGPGVAYVVARTVVGGTADGIGSCIGTAVGGMMHVLAATLGLSLLLAQSALAYSVMKYVGAAYLIYLGIQILTAGAATTDSVTVRQVGPGKALRDGIIVEALNVKTAMFFLAFIPQFVSAEHPLVPQFILLGTICVAFNTIVDLLAVIAVNRFVAVSTAKATRARILSRLSGLTMLSLGVFVAFTNKS